MKTVTVYCASSSKAGEPYESAARIAGEEIARLGLTLVYGGSFVGLMRTVATAARKGGAPVIGVTPQLMVDQGVHDPHCTQLIVTPDMRSRKAKLEELADAFLVLPGGIGTLEELFEVLVGRALGYHDKPIALVNTAGCYTPLLSALKDGISRNLVKESILSLLLVADTPAEALQLLKAAPRTMVDPSKTVFEFEHSKS